MLSNWGQEGAILDPVSELLVIYREEEEPVIHDVTRFVSSL